MRDQPDVAPRSESFHASPRAIAATERGLLSEARERMLLAAYAATGDRTALSELLRLHEPLVANIARRHRIGSIREEDLVAEGMLGLLEAARRFDVSYGVRFATYGAHWVRAYVRRHALTQRRIVSLPDTRASRRVLGRIGRTETRLASTLGRAPTDEELADAIGVTCDELREARTCVGARDVSLAPRPAGDRSTWEPADTRASPEEAVARAEENAFRTRELGRALAGLPVRERSIVERRFLADDPPALHVLASEMSISRERVRQLEARALERLRAAVAVAA